MTEPRQETLFCRVLRGIEWIAADEIQSLGLTLQPIQSERTLFFRASVERALRLQTVDDVFLHLLTHPDPGRTKSGFLETVQYWESVDWPGRLNRGGEFTISASFNGKRNFTRFDIEDALGRVISKQCGNQYTPHRDTSPDFAGNALRVHLDGSLVFVGLRLAPRPLHRRAWKVRTAPGTLHPPLAAAMTHFLNPGSAPLTVCDPFCGRGTILIELAQRAAVPVRCRGFDIASEAVDDALANAAGASVSIQFGLGDAGGLPLERASVDLIATNPPWGEQVATRHELLPRFVHETARVLSDHGCIVALHKWNSGLACELARQGFAVVHEQNLRLSGNISTLTFAARQGAWDHGSWPLDIPRLLKAREASVGHWISDQTPQ